MSEFIEIEYVLECNGCDERHRDRPVSVAAARAFYRSQGWVIGVVNVLCPKCRERTFGSGRHEEQHGIQQVHY